MKKRICICMLIAIIFSCFVVSPIANAMTEQDFDAKISQLKKDDPNGSQHYSSSYNGINFGSSCYGWAYMTGYKVFGSNPNSWSTTDSLSSVKKGDIIQYGNTSGNGHTVFVINVSGNTITFADCNGNGNRNAQGKYVDGLCMVKWDNTTTISANSLFGYSFSYIRSAPEINHTHNYNTYVYYWAAHPHYNCYKCSCGEVKENRNETRPIDTCAQCLAEYKPNASIDKDIYHIEENVTVSWDKINNAIHYNVRLYKIGDDGNGKLYDTTYNITDTSYTFSSLVPGDYYLYVQTYNKYYWMSDNSDYFHSQGDKLSFSVIDDSYPTATTQYGNNYYEYYNYQMSWLEALKFCERRGGHLAVINSSEENEVVYHLAKPYTTYAWLGGTDDGKEGKWYWINSDSFSYTNWNPGEPNNDGSGENCLELMTSDNHPGQWNDVPYNSTRVKGFICEYENNRVIDLAKYQPMIIQNYNGKKYEVYDNNVDWQTARLICERKGGHLVVIDDTNENTFVAKLISSCDKDEYWLGVSDYIDDGNWVTVLGEKVQFTNWTSGEPSNSSNVEDYAVIKKNNYWNDLKEYSGLYRSVGFICEYEPDTIILGDADGNGEVDISDATIIQRHLSSASVPYPDETLMNADVDGDGVLTILDATFIQRYVAMINTSYPIGEPKT